MLLHTPRLTRSFLLALLLGAAVPALGIDYEKAFDDPAMQARYEHINRELRCLVCQNQTIADSNATLAQDLRREVREMLVAGKSDDEIRTFMIERYGDFVLYRPRMTVGNFLLWAAPVLLLLLGTFIGIRVIRRQTAQMKDESPEAGQS
ncbi:MAG: cytochrome c-type biogenesis protein [Steroidobacteraceae bacterium]